MKTKTVYKKSILPADANSVFSLLRNLETLQYIAKPYASFTPTDHVIDFSKDSICTNESNTHVPIWNHRIRLKALSDGSTEYSDEVVISAGWKTELVWLWANFFYTHRQKKWIKLLSEKR